MCNRIISKKKYHPLSFWRGYFYSFVFSLTIWTLSSCTTEFYVVRHAEKSTSPKQDPDLTIAGTQRAERLKTILENKGIKKIYSTNTFRTMNTGKPLADLKSLEIEIYDPKNQATLIESLKNTRQNTLIVGHSNTIRYIINGLSEKDFLKKDLEDTEYSNLYLVKRGKFKKPKVVVKQF